MSRGDDIETDIDGANRRAVQRGRAVAAELKETDKAFADMRKAILDELVSTSPVSTDKILRLQAMVHALDAVHGMLKAVVQEGERSTVALAMTGQTRTGPRGR